MAKNKKVMIWYSEGDIAELLIRESALENAEVDFDLDELMGVTGCTVRGEYSNPNKKEVS